MPFISAGKRPVNSASPPADAESSATGGESKARKIPELPLQGGPSTSGKSGSDFPARGKKFFINLNAILMVHVNDESGVKVNSALTIFRD
jgi:hypothetical protein